jgi:hypothetical protein
MTSTEILKYISEGESETVEFKLRFSTDNSIARTLIAFANTQGGILLFGVSNTGEVVGIPEAEADETIARVHKLVTSLFAKPVDFGIVDLEGKHIMYVRIDGSIASPTPIRTSTGELYVREGTQNVNLNATTRQAIEQIMARNMSHNIGSHVFSYLLNKENPASSRPLIQCSAFVAMSFRSEEEPALVDYYRAMERAIESLKLPIKLIRMDSVEGNFEISQGIMDKIDDVDIVIADFTLNSANVYFELGYAKARNKHIIQTARKETVLEFDIRSWRTIFYRNATELEEQLKPELQATYKAIIDLKKGK